jgi:sugar/nucleoside kinase (ribokinase family)
VSGDDEQLYPRRSVDAVDATGAGDAFAGTLAAYLARGCPLVDAARFANAAAALETTALGTQTPVVNEQRLAEFLTRAIKPKT